MIIDNKVNLNVSVHNIRLGEKVNIALVKYY